MPAPQPTKESTPTNASFNFRPVRASDVEQCSFHVNAAIAGATTAAFKVQGCNDTVTVEADQSVSPAGTAAKWVDMTLPSGSVHGTGFVFSPPAVSVTWDGLAELNMIIDVRDLPARLRLVQTITAGGSASVNTYVYTQLRGPKI